METSGTSGTSGTTHLGFALAGMLTLTAGAYGGQNVLPAIPKGRIALNLKPVATGLSAPDYAISSNGQYRIPATNPFQGAGQVPEIYAYGFRKPYRFSFDTLNGELILADVGQGTVEEIDRVVHGITYGAEWSATLAAASWTPVPDTGTGTTHTFAIPIGSNTAMFMRFVVTTP